MSAFPDSDVRLRTNAVGCLLNVIMGQDQCYPQVSRNNFRIIGGQITQSKIWIKSKQLFLYPLSLQVVEMGVMEILCDLLTFGIGTKTEEETAVHIYVILGLLTDAGRCSDGGYG